MKLRSTFARMCWSGVAGGFVGAVVVSAPTVHSASESVDANGARALRVAKPLAPLRSASKDFSAKVSPGVLAPVYDHKVIPGSNCRATSGDPLIRTATWVQSTGTTEVACPLERDANSTFTELSLTARIWDQPSCVLWSCNSYGTACQNAMVFWWGPDVWSSISWYLTGRWTTATEVLHCQLQGDHKIDRLLYSEIDP